MLDKLEFDYSNKNAYTLLLKSFASSYAYYIIEASDLQDGVRYRLRGYRAYIAAKLLTARTRSDIMDIKYKRVKVFLEVDETSTFTVRFKSGSVMAVKDGSAR